MLILKPLLEDETSLKIVVLHSRIQRESLLTTERYIFMNPEMQLLFDVD